jgi:hypothetical protein
MLHSATETNAMQRPWWLTIAAIARVYSIPYTALAGVVAMMTATMAVPLQTACVSGLWLLTFSVGLAALNDLAHAQADARAGRGRAYPPGVLATLSGIGILGTMLLSLWGGWMVWLGLAASLATGVAYALAKSIPLLSNIVRGLTSFAIILTLAAFHQAGASGVWIALGVALLDASGNLWGDVRDRQVDARAGVTTLAVRHPQQARWAALGLHAGACALFALVTPLVWVSLLATLWAWKTTERRSHRAFLLGKYGTMGVLGLTLASTATEVGLSIVLSAAAIPAWVLYTSIHPLDQREHP